MTNGNVAGTLKFYFTDYNHITTSTKQLARGLADFSSQLELGLAETQSKLLRDAEIKSLQAQVNPHFSLMRLTPFQHLYVLTVKSTQVTFAIESIFRIKLTRCA